MDRHQMKNPEDATAFAPADTGGEALARSGSPLERDKKFPEILMDILSDESYAAIIGWLPCGERFVVRDQKKFPSDVLPRHFSRGTNFLSFRRKLNRYGFNAVRQSTINVGPIFKHKHFRRGHPELLGNIYCQKKQASGKASVAKSRVVGNGAAEEKKRASGKVSDANNGVAGSNMAEDVVGGCGAAAATEVSANNHTIAPSYTTAGAAAASTQARWSSVVKSSVAGRVVAEDVARGFGAAGAAAVICQGGRGFPVAVPEPFMSRHAVTPSYNVVNATAVATRYTGGTLVPLINNTESSLMRNHAVAPSYHALSDAAILSQVPGEVPVSFLSSVEAGIFNARATAPRYSTHIDDVAVTQVPGGVPAINSAESGIVNVRAAAPSYSSLMVAAAARVPREVPAFHNPVVAPAYGAARAAAVAGRIPRGAPLQPTSGAARDAAFHNLLEGELLLRELKQRRRQALERLLCDARMPAGDNGS